MPLVSLTRATFRKAEFGFLGVAVKTLTQIPRLNGELQSRGRFFKTLNPKVSAGAFVFDARRGRLCLIS